MHPMHNAPLAITDLRLVEYTTEELVVAHDHRVLSRFAHILAPQLGWDLALALQRQCSSGICGDLEARIRIP